jgi:protein-tyrosine phosphatase
MHGYIDLHSHWIPAIDDGAHTLAEGIDLLRALRQAGFDTVIATPHMRPGMFDNDRAVIAQAFEQARAALAGEPDLPELGLGCEHFLDDIVFSRLLSGEALPYPGNRAALLELPADQLPARLGDRLFDLRRKGLRPVIAHPERCSALCKKPEVTEGLVDQGMVLLMDVGALAGKYGRTSRRCAETLLEAGLYYAVCSDAHKPSDVAQVRDGIERLHAIVGADEARFLLRDGPRAVLDGKVDL